MIKNLKQHKYAFIYLFCVVTTVLLIIASAQNDENYVFEEFDGIPFNHLWQYEFGDGLSGETELPGILPKTSTSDTVSFTNTIPHLDHDIFFSFRARHSKIKIYIDNQLVYNQIDALADDDTWFTLPANVYHLIPVSIDDSGKSIKIETTCSSKQYLIKPGAVYLGERGSFFMHILKDKIPTIVCSLTLFIVATILLILWFVLTFIVKASFYEGLCLSGFTYTISIWLFTETPMTQFLCHNNKFITVMAYELLCLAPIPIALYFSFGNHRPRTKKLSKIVASIPIFFWIFENFMHLAGFIPLQDTLMLTQCLIVVELLMISWIQTSELLHIQKTKTKYTGSYWKIPFVGIATVFILGTTETLKYMFGVNQYPDDGILIAVGILFYIISLAVESAVRLTHTSSELIKASEEKSQFLANMSHEIRTPLNAILGFDEMILRESHEDKVKEYASSIQSAGDTLKDIINSILDISKIESGKLELYSTEYNSIQLLDNVISMSEALATKKGLDFYSYIDPNIPENLIGDSAHLRQILMNILNNAIKYTQKGSVSFTAKIAYQTKDSPLCSIYFSVQDTGIGIKDEDRNRLFKKFERLDQEKNHNTEGTGLGMSIVVNLLKAMGSKIELDSTYGVGSTFYFTLEQCSVNDKKIGNFDEQRKNINLKNAESLDYIAPEAEILIVDDVPMNLSVASALLERLQVKIDTADSGYKAIEMVQQKHYDIVLMDHMMPGLDGVAATQKIREMAENTGDIYYAFLPILALTANVMMGMKEMFMQAGMQDFIAKPVEFKTLSAAIKAWLPKEKIKSLTEEEAKKLEDSKQQESEEWNFTIDTIDLDAARQFNTSLEMYQKSLKDFYQGIESTRAKIQKFCEEQDLKNYTITVHGLKSTSKIIGAMDLSNKALELESRANNNDVPSVFEDTDQLFALYKDTEEALIEYLHIDINQEEKVLSDEAFTEIIERIREAADEFDMGVFMELEEELDGVTVAGDKEEAFKNLKEAIRNASFSEALEIIDNM